MNSSVFRSCALLAVLMGACIARAASPAVEAVLAADQARLAALMAGDAAALTRLFSDELLFVHSDGRIEGKADYVRNLLAGDTAYAQARTLNLRSQEPAPGVVVLIGAQEMRKRLGPDWSEVKLRFLAVWRQEAGAWRMVSWQSMRPSGNSVVPKQ
jgi:ketosteroid isomerase-like protein